MTPIAQALDFITARRQAGLSDETMHLLLTILSQGPSTRQNLASVCEINATTLPRYLSSLVTSGHLVKSGGAADKREVFFGLSEHGERLANSLLKHFPAKPLPCPT
jgi:DNA-binding MarR family transcriptional regulator